MKNKNWIRRTMTPALIGATWLATPSGARSAVITWSGSAGDNNWQTGGNWTGNAAPVTSASSALLTNAGNPTAIDADGSFTVNYVQVGTSTAGSGTAALSINNSVTGGSISLAIPAATGAALRTGNKQANSVAYNTNLTLAPSSGTTTLFNIGTVQTTINGVISDGGSGIGLTKTGDKALIVTGLNSYSGPTLVEQNNIQLGVNAPAGAAGGLGNATTPVQLGDATTTAAQSAGLVTNGNYTVGRDISVYNISANSTGAIVIGGTTGQTVGSAYTGQITLNGAANFQSATTGTNVIDFAGQITGPGAFNKTSAGAVQLDNANNNYTGATNITAGTLIINGQSTGGGAYAVTAGTLGGIGSITTGSGVSGLSVANGSTLTPGLVAGGTANSGTTFTVIGDVTLDGALSIQADSAVSRLFTTGALTINADSTLVFTGTSSLNDPAYVIGSYSTLNGTWGSITNQPAGYALDYAYNGDEIALVQSSETPEPAGTALAGIGAAGLLMARRRFRKLDAASC